MQVRLERRKLILVWRTSPTRGTGFGVKNSPKPDECPSIIVFSGPPLSGKSGLSKLLAADGDYVRFEMDKLRADIRPNSDHSKEDRNLAYRAMHAEVDKALRSKRLRPVIVDATYSPSEHRLGLKLVADLHGANVYLVECQVSPNTAAQRFRDGRKVDHPGVDLTEARVRQIATKFRYHGGGRLVRTGLPNSLDTDLQRELKRIQSYLRQGQPVVTLEDWVMAGTPNLGSSSFDDWLRARTANPSATEMDRGTGIPSPPSEVLISSWSIFTSRLLLVAAIALCLFAFITIFLLAAPMAAWQIGRWKFGARSIESFATVGTAVFVFVAVEEYIRRGYLLVPWQIHRAGSAPEFGVHQTITRTNRELIADYQERMALEPGVLKELMPLTSAPIFFLVPPKNAVTFAVWDRPGDLVSQGWDSSSVASSAAGTTVTHSNYLRFSWGEYARWRVKQTAGRYFGRSRLSRGRFRLTAIEFPVERNDGKSMLVCADGVRTSYASFLLTEGSTDIEISGQIPYLREFLEGRPWVDGTLDLTAGALGNSHYSLASSVQVIITTADGYVVLTRRSRHVRDAKGGTASSAAGHVDWKDIRPSTVRKLFLPSARKGQGIHRAVFREVREELSLRRQDFTSKEPRFMAVAFNLKYGRDVNFYAHLESTLTHQAIVERLRPRFPQRLVDRALFRGRGRWEADHLLFIHVRDIPDPSHPNDPARFSPLCNNLLAEGRHVRGALYALVASGELARVRDRRFLSETWGC